MIPEEKLHKVLCDIMGGPPNNCAMKNPDHYNVLVDVRKIMRLSNMPEWRDLADPPRPKLYACPCCKRLKPAEYFKQMPAGNGVVIMCTECKTSAWQEFKPT